MKKKIISLILIILIIVIAVIIGKKVIKSKEKNELEKIENFNYFKYNEDNKYGIIDKDGNVVIEAEYSNIIIPNPEKDIFICYGENNDKSKVLNSSKKELFDKYDDIEPIKLKSIASILCYEKGVLKYKKDGLYGLIDFDGKEISKNIYSSIENLQSTEGKFMIQKDNKFGVINTKGKVLVETDYDQVVTDDYYNESTGYKDSGFIVARKTDDGYRFGYISSTGKVELDTEFNELKRITELEDIYIIASKNGQFGLYKGSKEIIEPNYQSIDYSENDVLIIRKNSNYGLADLKGNILIDTKYTNIESKGIYIYAENDKESKVFDINGNKLDMNFNKTIYKTNNENYMISTIINNDITYYGLENSKGDTIIKPYYSYLEYLFDDYFIVKDENEKYGIIDSKDNKVIDFKYDVIQKIKDKNIIQAVNMKKQETELFSSKLESIMKMEKAIINNEEDYLIIKNEKEKVYIDNEGNKIDENSEVVLKAQNKKLPEEIGQYKKVQYSLEDAYYEKKDK